MKPFVLVDASSYFFRAFHALPPLSNSKGQPTGAVYGVVNMMRRLMKDYPESHIIVIFDAKGKTFRDDLYPQYKANRAPMPDELSVQFKPLLQVIEAMGFPLLMIEGVEADDVIATLAQQATALKKSLIISTGDKDLAQLVNSYVTLINTMTNTTLDEAGVKEKFGVTPEQMIDYLTLIGDSVDNVPGVPKVGPKTAVKWLDHYGTLAEIMAKADEFKGKVGDNLRASLNFLPLSKELITLKREVSLDFALPELTSSPPDKARLIELFQQLEFRTWLKALLEDEDTPDEAQTGNYQTVLSEADFKVWLQRLAAAKSFAFDTETTSLNVIDAEIVGVSFAIKAGEAAYAPCGHDYENAPIQLSREFVLSQLKPLLENENTKIIGQNLKYDRSVLANYDIQLNGLAYDTMLESYVLNSVASRHDMDSLALRYLGKQTIQFTDVAGRGAKQVTFNQVTLEQATPYAAEDADITLQLHEVLWPQVAEVEGLQRVFTELEMPLIAVLSRVERRGVLIDAKLLKQQSDVFAKRIVDLEAQAHTIAEENFNLASPKQLQEILYDKLKLPVLKKTPKGQASTAEAVLQELAYDYPLPKVIMEYRQLAKLKSTYLDALPTFINARTGRVHTSYHQAVTATGRLSSSDPNLQNIPVRTPEGRYIRKAFIAPEGYKIISVDYSQIELRIMAHLSQDPGLLQAFAQGLDIHQATAAEVFNTPLEKVTAEQRRHSKAINFGLIYGMSAFGLAKQLGVTREAAQDYMDCYFQRYPGVQAYMQATREQAHQNGFVETLMGRRLYLPEINARNFQRQRAAERTAINAPMQGTAADLMKKAMIEMDAWLRKLKLDAYMIMQVHDELVFEVAHNEVEAAKVEIEKIMTSVLTLESPLRVSIGVGDNWEVAH
ncbi:MAG: DNA polymerase I [Gammaproteobacteria bacterium]